MNPHPATMLRALKGPPISIVLALTLYPGRSLGPAKLAQLTGYSERATRDGLATLAELGLAQRHSHHNGWTATTRLRQLILGEAAQQTTTALPSGPARSKVGGTAKGLPHPANPAALDPLKQRQEGHEPANVAASPVVVVDPDPAPDLPQHQQQPPRPANSAACPGPALEPGPEQSRRGSEGPTRTGLACRLQALGIWQARARDLARDPWVTGDRADRWHQNILDQLSAHPGSIRNPAALLAANLANHREPPQAAPPDDWRRFEHPDIDYIGG